MTFVRANPPGWALFELLTSAQMNIVDSQIPFALDGAAGGSYVPSAPIQIDGSSLASGSVLELTGSPNEAAILITADDATPTTGGMLVQASVDVEGLRLEPSGTRSQGGSPNMMLNVTGHSNDAGGGGLGTSSVGGDSSTNAGAGVYGEGGTVIGVSGTAIAGNGVFGQGGAAQAAGQAGGTGVIGVGGTPLGGGNLDQGQAAGVRGTGGSTTGSDGAGHGVVGIGGSSSSGVSGAGGYFQGTGGRAGVIATGGSSGAYGGIFTGTGALEGLRAVVGSAGNAIRSDGAINFDLGSGTNKNPATTTPIQNQLFAKNLIKAWGFVIDGALVAGFNVASVVAGGATNQVIVTLAQPMASVNYGVICSSTHNFGGGPRQYSKRMLDGSADQPTTSTFLIGQWDAGGGVLNMNDSEFSFIVIGEQ